MPNIASEKGETYLKMENAWLLTSGLVLLCSLVVLGAVSIEESPVKLDSLPQASHSSCFVSCSCEGSGDIHCVDSDTFRQEIRNFNQFLFHFSAGSNARLSLKTRTTSLPDFLPELPVLRHLSLTGNNLQTLQTSLLKGMRLRQLNLSHNALRHIERGALEGLDHLRVLDLSHNQLTSLSHITSLPSLEELNVDFNRLIFFPSAVSSLAPGLKVLRLNSNALSYLGPRSLHNFSSLEVLELRNNSFMHFVTDLQRQMPSLKVLDASLNPFHCSCGLRGLERVLNSSRVSLIAAEDTVCRTPLGLNGRRVLDVVQGLKPCTHPRSITTFDTNDVLYLSEVNVHCDIQGDPDPAVLWLTPWGHQFAVPAHWPRLQAVCRPCRQQRVYRGLGIGIMAKSVVTVQDGGKSLRITNFRSFFNGNITCRAINYLGEDIAVRNVAVYTAIKPTIFQSLIYGGLCAAAFLCLGLIVGSVKLLVLACLKRFGKVKDIHHTPSSSREENASLSEQSTCKDSLQYESDEFYPPDVPYTTPVCVTPSESPPDYPTLEDGETTPPGGWLPSNILETMEEVRFRLRYGMGRRIETVRQQVHSLKATGRRNVQSIKESGSVYVHNIMETGSTAASKVKAGVVMGMETVKFHVQSMKEFCGTGDMGHQTVSAVSMETNLDTNQTTEVVRSVTVV